MKVARSQNTKSVLFGFFYSTVNSILSKNPVSVSLKSITAMGHRIKWQKPRKTFCWIPVCVTENMSLRNHFTQLIWTEHWSVPCPSCAWLPCFLKSKASILSWSHTQLKNHFSNLEWLWTLLLIPALNKGRPIPMSLSPGQPKLQREILSPKIKKAKKKKRKEKNVHLSSLFLEFNILGWDGYRWRLTYQGK